ncbi:hypothetical protein HID58_071008 [Brassica napus]|uniref:Uncharacterized protein n=1 Tax=Brassica napus TaxID=3708 RepID=A0ABQ7Z0C8_BRANA|nr:hypothetical protein HID58_071008 [Brassica napus]
MSQLALPSNFQNNERPRSPSGEAQKRTSPRYQYPGYSRGDKRRSKRLWRKGLFTGTTQVQASGTAWKIGITMKHLGERESSRAGPCQRQLGNHRGPKNNRAGNYREDRGNTRSYNRTYVHSKQVWRPRSPSKEISKEHLGMTDKDVQRDSPRRKADSQLIVSELPTMRNHPTGHENEPINGVLIVHQNESSEEHLRRLKGKAIMTRQPSKHTNLCNHTAVQLAGELTGVMVELAGELTRVTVQLSGEWLLCGIRSFLHFRSFFQ